MMSFDIQLKNLRFYSYHGVLEHERRNGNLFIVNLTVTIPFNEGIDNDELESTISYEDLFTIVREEMATPGKLLEKVALNIRDSIKEKFSQIERGTIEIEKVHAPIKEMLGSAAVTLNF